MWSRDVNLCYRAGRDIQAGRVWTNSYGDSDILLGELEAGTPEPVKIYMSVEQFEYWKHTHLTIDIVPGRGAGFSLEAPTGNRFLIRSRLFTDDEYTALGQESPARKVGVQAAP